MSTQLVLFAQPQHRKARSYHVRQPIPGPASEAAQEIKRGEGKARQQEEAILAFYRWAGKPLSPSQVWSGLTCRYSFATFLLTSVRRGITNLADQGRLRRTDERVMGPFGAKEFLWELVPAKEVTQ